MVRILGIGIGELVGAIDIDDPRIAIVDADPLIFRQLAINQLVRIDVSVPQHVREAAVDPEHQRLESLQV